MLFVLLTGCASHQPQPVLERCQFTRICMGVQCRITIYSANAQIAEEAAKAAFSRISEIDAEVSDYRVDSDVAKLTKHAGNGTLIPLQPDTLELLKRSIEIAQATSGAFDPTVGPVTRLWRQVRQTKVMPSDAEFQAIAPLVNFRLLKIERLTDGTPVMSLPRTGMSLDFGAIAKGYAAEHAVLVLQSLGAKSCLVALSGDIFAGDPPPGEDGWLVDISSGQNGERPEAQVRIANEGLSTSGDTEQFVEIAGVRYSHIIDPRKAWAVTERRSVTVIAPHGWIHDALSTAVCAGSSAEGTAAMSHYPLSVAIIFEKVSGTVHRRTIGSEGVLARVRFMKD